MRRAPRAFPGSSAIRCVVRVAAATASIVCLSAALAALGFLGALHSAASETPASPSRPDEQGEDGFPCVDWDYWRQVNPDIVGWITIPGTPVDYPVAQAPASDPLYYLTHDVYGNRNFMGCPYLDAGCAQGGLEESPNAMLFGHNLGYGDESMFASIAKYTDPGFMESHREVLVQTPRLKTRFKVAGALCMQGATPTKRTEFENRRDLAAWFAERMAECQTKTREGAPAAEQVLTLCTCSYSTWNDERTLLFAVR